MSRKRHELVSVLLLAALAVTGAYMFRFLFSTESESPPSTETVNITESNQPAAVDRLARVEPMIQRWMESISSKNPDLYIRLFTDGFNNATPEARQHWENLVRQELGREGAISASVRNLSVIPTDNPDRVRVELEQSYTTSQGSNLLKRDLVLRWKGQGWKIAREATTFMDTPDGNVSGAPSEQTAAVSGASAPVGAGSPAKFETGIINSLNRWSEAWSRQDLGGFLSAYSADYPGVSNMDADQWHKKAEEMVTRPAWIKAYLSDFTVNQQTDRQAIVNVSLLFVSDTEQEQDDIRLLVRFTANGWKIVDDDLVDNSLNENPPGPSAAGTAPASENQVAAVDPDTPGDESDREEVLSIVNHWAASWEAQEVDEYLDNYSDRLKLPKGHSYALWRKSKHERIPVPEWIRINLSDIELVSVTVSRAELTFVQDYQSSTFSDRTRKKLVLEQEDADWKIVEETVLETL